MDDIRTALCSAPVMTHPDFTKEFILATDFSKEGLGAILSQKGEDGKEHPVAYASRRTNEAESQYPAIRGEFLAAVWAIRHFHHYLAVNPFILRSDQQAL